MKILALRKPATLTITALLLALASTASADDKGRYTRDQGIGATLAGGSGGAAMDNKPYSASYLPRTSGPLSNSNDAEIKRMIENGFGDCNLVHQVIKDNAAKATTEKFDAAVEKAEGTNPGLTASYKRDGYNPNAEGWEGFCHLWAPAGLDPASGFIVAMDRIYADVPFGIGDLRELTTYNYPRANTRFFGKRHNDKDRPEAKGDELDAVDLLAIFENYVGPGKPGVVLDVDPGYMVWNQPVSSYKTESTELSGDAASGAPSGGKAFSVVLTAEYGLEGHYAYRGDAITSSKTWNMIVYTDKDGKVTKAKWADNRGDAIPDFAWVPEVKRSSPNFDRLKKIATEGVAVKDIESFCKMMQDLTADGFAAGDAKKIAAALSKICPVLDQNKLSDYIRATAERTGIDYSLLDSALSEGNEGIDAHS